MNATGNRHQSRADWHDYCDGVYFVTICSPDKKHIFGEIAEGEMRLSELGRIAADCLHEIPAHHPDAEIISQVVMPNHLHIIIAITRPAIGNLGIVGHPLPPTTVGTPAIPGSAIPGPVRTRYIASSSAESIIASPSAESIIAKSNILGCLKPPKHGEICNDFHHNSRLAVIVGSFKVAVTRLARTRYIASLPVWQPRFHEHIIRNQYALDNIMTYIDENVSRWDKDCFNNTDTDN